MVEDLIMVEEEVELEVVELLEVIHQVVEDQVQQVQLQVHL